MCAERLRKRVETTKRTAHEVVRPRAAGASHVRSQHPTCDLEGFLIICALEKRTREDSLRRQESWS